MPGLLRLLPLPLLVFSAFVLPARAAEADGSTSTTPVAEAAPEAVAAPAVEQPDSWAYTLEAYGFVPWVNATTTVRGFETETYLPPGQILNLLQSVFSGRASAEKGRLGALVDVSYNQLGAQNSVNSRRDLFTGRSDVTSINGLYDLALRYRFGARESAIGQPGSYWLIPYAGLRIVQAQLGVQAQVEGNGPFGLSLQRQGELNRTWTQLLLGTQASVFLTPGLRLFGRADIGGFGMAGTQDLSGNAQVGFGYALGNNTDLNVSWRYLGIAYNNGAPRSTGYTSDQNGVEVGVKFYF
jgi:hypothetical protein